MIVIAQGGQQAFEQARQGMRKSRQQGIFTARVRDGRALRALLIDEGQQGVLNPLPAAPDNRGIKVGQREFDGWLEPPVPVSAMGESVALPARPKRNEHRDRRR